MSKHTPGPWDWSPHYKTGDGRATWSLIGSQDGYGILSCDGDENSPQGLNDEANARLIAAAPELLEALTQIHDVYAAMRQRLSVDYANDGWSAETITLDKAKAAIAKATGEQP